METFKAQESVKNSLIALQTGAQRNKKCYTIQSNILLYEKTLPVICKSINKQMCFKCSLKGR